MRLTCSPAKTLASSGIFSMLCGDFFLLATDPSLQDLLHPADGYGAILVDIDHAPDALLSEHHAHFYAEPALRAVAERLTDGGVFALWSTGGTQPRFVDQLRAVFPEVGSEAVEFFNPVADRDEVNTIYLARKALQGVRAWRTSACGLRHHHHTGAL